MGIFECDPIPRYVEIEMHSVGFLHTQKTVRAQQNGLGIDMWDFVKSENKNKV